MTTVSLIYALSGWPIQYVSNNIHELLGYDADYLSEKQVSYAKLIHPEDVHRAQSEVNACLSDKENSLGELTSLHEYIESAMNYSYKWVNA